MTDASTMFLVFLNVLMVAVFHLNGRQVVSARKDARRWEERCRHATARAKRRGRELRARDVAGQRRNAKAQEPELTWNDLESIHASSR